MTLEQLRIFVAVAERLHMTRAAEALGMTQSAVSAAVASLESQHRVLLFNRVGRGLELSAAGALFVAEARGVLGRAHAAVEALNDLTGLKRGNVAVAASQTIANYWLPGKLATFASEYPGVSVRLIVANTAQAAQMAADGGVDFSLVEGAVADQRLIRRIVGADRLSIYAAPAHPLTRKPRVSIDDLKEAQWVLREAGSGTRSELELALSARRLDPKCLNALLELPSNEAVLGAVEGAGLITAVSDLAAAPHVALGNITRVGFSLTDRHFTLLSHVDRAMSHAAEAFASKL